MTILIAALIGIVAGMRAMYAPTAISWAAYAGQLRLEDSWLAFLGFAWTPWVLSALAIGEFIVDKLPSTPSRTMVISFLVRLLTGFISGAAIGIAMNAPILAAAAGAVGALLGTFLGYGMRAQLSRAFGKDLLAALLEDALAIGLAMFVLTSLVSNGG